MAAEHHVRERVLSEQRSQRRRAVRLHRVRDVRIHGAVRAREDDEGVRQDVRELVRASREGVETHRADQIERHGGEYHAACARECSTRGDYAQRRRFIGSPRQGSRLGVSRKVASVFQGPAMVDHTAVRISKISK